MRLNIEKLANELANTEDDKNELENYDPSTDFTIYNELFVPLSNDKEVFFSDISLAKFDFDDICVFIQSLIEHENETRQQYNWLKILEKLSPTTKQTKTFF